ncbi:MAG: protein translocase subunit SecF, partial [Alphaproteobacteria bacterium]|nr:protein translocase subunit SecF [Alphaproteobacteria bacterium]
MRLRLVPDDTNINFFGLSKITFGGSIVLLVLSLVAYLAFGLNYGIDFKGGTTIRTESTQAVDVGAYRAALDPLGLGDVTITEVFDPGFGPDRNVAEVRIQAQGDAESITPATMTAIQGALTAVDPDVQFASVESVGPKVSGELIRSAVLSVLGAIAAIVVYIWLRFEWQFALGGIVVLAHDV